MALIKIYLEQLNKATTDKSKCFVLQRFIADTTGKSVSYNVIMKIIKLYGLMVVFNAIIAINSKVFNTEEDLTSYLFAVCRNKYIEELQIEQRKKIKSNRETTEDIKRIYKEHHGSFQSPSQ